MKLVSRVDAIIYGKDNPERKPDPTVWRIGVGLTTPPCLKD
jgi:beta-phosphoglucomutase-like phosphatase (HAD superfamily)